LLAIGYEEKRPDFTLVSIDGFLHIVEIKKSGHDFDDADFERLIRYVDAFEDFFEQNHKLAANFHRGWRIDVVADGEKVKNLSNKHAYNGFKDSGKVDRMSWHDFLDRAKKVNEQFLEVHDLGVERRKEKNRDESVGGVL
jgi:hypothetical protein